jgi:hypothetical protein
MPIPRYERQEEETATPRFTRAVLKAFGIAALIGLLLGLIWIVAGVVGFNRPW